MSNILIVDDEKEIADLIEIYLKNENYNVYKYYSSEHIMNDLENIKIDLAILDIMMPGVDGFSLCEEIRKKYNFPIIFVTAKVENIDKMINEIKDYGLKVGIAVNPDTDIKNIFPYLDRIDLVLIMSVYPGKSGQTFIEKTVDKIKELKEYITENDLKTQISVDGGINNETGKLCKDAGADILVSASYIHNDIKHNIDILKNI